MNIAILKGRLGQSPELKYTQGGTAVTTLSIATKEYKKDGDSKTTWHRCKAFGKTAENISKFFSKGQEILITGRMENYSFEKQNGEKGYIHEIIVTRFEFCGSGDHGNDNQQQQTEPKQEQQEAFEPEGDDLPF